MQAWNTPYGFGFFRWDDEAFHIDELDIRRDFGRDGEINEPDEEVRWSKSWHDVDLDSTALFNWWTSTADAPAFLPIFIHSENDR